MMKALKAQSKAGNAARLSRIVGGGKGRPTADANDGRLVAKAKRAAPMAVEGKPARPRLDRPGRRMKRADGGPAWTGEGDSGRPMKEKAAELRDEATVNDSSAKREALTGAGTLAVGKYLVPKRNFGSKTAALIGGLGMLGSAGVQKLAASGRRMAADKADKAGDEAEGKKRGGSVRR